MADEFGRDERDGLREVMKTEEEVRLEEELVGRVDRIKVCVSVTVSEMGSN
jgi:hypothetical protein